MRKIIVFIVIALGSSMACFSQSVFPESGAIWNYHRYVNNSLKNEWIYGLSGDTIINDLRYNKLYLLNDTTLQIDALDKYLGGFRQENKQVWFYPAETGCMETLNKEVLFFDFGKEIGAQTYYDYYDLQSVFDPEYCIHSGISEWTETITDIQETPFGRRFILNRFDLEYIEGIGSIYGMYGGGLAHPTDGNGYRIELACFKYQNEIKYLNSECNKCFCWENGSNIIQNTVEKSPIRIISRTNRLEIEAPSSVLPFQIELIDLLGQRVSLHYVDTEYVEIPTRGYHGTLLYRINAKDLPAKAGKIILF